MRLSAPRPDRNPAIENILERAVGFHHPQRPVEFSGQNIVPGRTAQASISSVMGE